MDNLTIRPVTPDDIADIAALEALIFPDPWSEASLASALSDEKHTFLCVEQDGTVAAYLLGCGVAGESEILRVATHPSFRRRGLGRDLVRSFISERMNEGDSTVFLEVRASNISAIALYASCGFASFAVRRNYYRNPTEDAVMMRFDLGN